jgi:ketosteroid isomerase-like protein
MSVSTLPQPIATYFAADRANDLDALSQVFADDALVHDESHDYRGIAAIRAWKQASQEKYQYSAEILDATVTEQSTVVRARLTGNFPGSPAELTYTFTLVDNKIAILEID